MSKGDNSPGMSAFAGAMMGMASRSQDKSLVIDFGVIQGDGSLLTNTYPVPIPKTDYVVCNCGGLPDGEWVNTSDGARVNIARQHTKHIKPGDHVLVAWVNNDPVVIDKIISAVKALGG